MTRSKGIALSDKAVGLLELAYGSGASIADLARALRPLTGEPIIPGISAAFRRPAS